MKAGYLEHGAVCALQAAVTKSPRPRTGAWLPLAVSLETGLRIGDVVSLPAGALDGDTISYVAQKTGKRGRAKIPFTLAEEIRAGANSLWLFPSPYQGGTTHLTRQAVWKRLKRAARRAGLAEEGVSPHSMRKVFAVDLHAREGLAAVQKALQHSRIDVTELYALSDYLSAANADKPLTRADVPTILHLAVDAIQAALKKSRNA